VTIAPGATSSVCPFRLGSPQRLDGDAGGRAGPVLDHDRLSKAHRKFFAHKTRTDVDRTSGRKPDQDLDRAALRLGARDDRKRARECQQHRPHEISCAHDFGPISLEEQCFGGGWLDDGSDVGATPAQI
jgi:hypothetical protein